MGTMRASGKEPIFSANDKRADGVLYGVGVRPQQNMVHESDGAVELTLGVRDGFAEHALRRGIVTAFHQPCTEFGEYRAQSFFTFFQESFFVQRQLLQRFPTLPFDTVYLGNDIHRFLALLWLLATLTASTNLRLIWAKQETWTMSGRPSR